MMSCLTFSIVSGFRPYENFKETSLDLYAKPPEQWADGA
jgi:hypothetical protein